MRRVLRMWFAILAGAAGLALAPAGAQTPKVKLWGASATMEAYHGFLFLGNPLGFYKDEGVEVEFGTAAGSAPTIQLLASNQANMGYVSMDLLLLAKAKNPTLPVVAVYLHDRGNIYELVVPEESDIKRPVDLKGKKIGVANLGSGGVPFSKGLLKEAGLSEDSAELLPVGNGAQAAAALRTSQVHALALFRAQHALVESLGFKFRYFTRDAPSAVIAVNESFLRSNRDAVVRVLRGIVKATTFAEANPQAAVQEFWKVYGKPQGISEEEGMRRQTHVLASTGRLWKDYRDSSTKWGDMSAGDWGKVQSNLLDQKLIEKPVPLEQIFTTDLIDDVNKVDVGPVLARAQAAR